MCKRNVLQGSRVDCAEEGCVQSLVTGQPVVLGRIELPLKVAATLKPVTGDGSGACST